MKDCSRQISMLCPLCGNDQFEIMAEDIDQLFICSDCGSTYTKDNLIMENSVAIENASAEMIDKYMASISTELSKKTKGLFK